MINLARWPVLWPGHFGSHELFHFFVIAGSASHIFFMLKIVVPASEPIPPPAKTDAAKPNQVLVFPRRALWKSPDVLRIRWAETAIMAVRQPIDRRS